ncbi:MAG: hypothetical protein J3R72DRAFT_495858 [Linnemannia gamsii]|nr:MAG: hypothetical protein J3R72DRAFT_495858 [Linnemannia gamsii]
MTPTTRKIATGKSKATDEHTTEPSAEQPSIHEPVNNIELTPNEHDSSSKFTSSPHNSTMEVDSESPKDVMESLEVLLEHAKNELKKLRLDNERIHIRLLALSTTLSKDPNNKKTEKEYESLIKQMANLNRQPGETYHSNYRHDNPSAKTFPGITAFCEQMGEITGPDDSQDTTNSIDFNSSSSSTSSDTHFSSNNRGNFRGNHRGNYRGGYRGGRQSNNRNKPYWHNQAYPPQQPLYNNFHYPYPPYNNNNSYAPYQQQQPFPFQPNNNMQQQQQPTPSANNWCEGCGWNATHLTQDCKFCTYCQNRGHVYETCRKRLRHEARQAENQNNNNQRGPLKPGHGGNSHIDHKGNANNSNKANNTNDGNRSNKGQPTKQ